MSDCSVFFPGKKHEGLNTSFIFWNSCIWKINDNTFNLQFLAMTFLKIHYIIQKTDIPIQLLHPNALSLLIPHIN